MLYTYSGQAVDLRPGAVYGTISSSIVCVTRSLETTQILRDLFEQNRTKDTRSGEEHRFRWCKTRRQWNACLRAVMRPSVPSVPPQALF